jgi:Fungal N-terminal domain of STAND proteins
LVWSALETDMSGIEIISIAASVLQLADLGGRLSVKLFTFSRKIKNADKSIASISAEIAQTGSILQQLGNELQKDDQLRLCSAEAVATAKALVEECYKVFDELNESLESKSPKNKVVAAWKQRLKFPLIEPQVDLLRTNLERLKSSLLVMLNVLIFAEQLRNQEALPILKDQRELVRTLVEDKNASEAKLQRVLRAIEDLKVADVAPPYSVSNANALVPTAVMPSATDSARSVIEEKSPKLPSALKAREEEIRHQCALLRNVIDEIGFQHYKIDHGLRDRMHLGVLSAHWDGWCALRNLYGDEVLLQAFSEVPAVVSFSMDWRPEVRSSSRD